jgi:type III pantothenate kinase
MADATATPVPQTISKPVLAIDIGNSRIKLGLFDGSSIAETPGLPACVRFLALPVAEPIPWPELLRWARALTDEAPHAVAASVNPAGLETLLAGWPETGWPVPKVIGGAAELPLAVQVESPQRVGIDRLLNAVAANRIRPVDRPAVIVDSGTATTVDLVSAGGAFEGGAILPGLSLAALSLHQYTALLPLITAEELTGAVPEPLGRSTRAALQSGIFWGQVGAVKELIARLVAGCHAEPVLLLAGGASQLLAPHLSPAAIWVPHLPLQGLALIANP